jgi:hypothetical protein
VTGYHALIDFWRSLVNTDHVRNLTATILTARTRTTSFTPLPQGCDQLGAQLTARHRIERRVDGFVADTHRAIIWEHAWKYARNLFWRKSFPKQLLNLRPQKAVGSQTRRVAAAAAPQRSALMSKNRAVTPRQSGSTSPNGLGFWVTPLVTSKLSTHRAGASIQASSNCPNGAPSLKTQLNQSSLFTIKMFVFGFHRNTVP